jgi:hypothetical protein
MFGKKKENGKHFTPPAGDQVPVEPTTKKVSLPPNIVEVVKYRFAEIVSCQEAMGVLASLSGQKNRSMWDFLKKQMPGVDFTKAQIAFDEKGVPFIEVYS